MPFLVKILKHSSYNIYDEFLKKLSETYLKLTLKWKQCTIVLRQYMQ